ncbi:hypothetical protein BT93_K0700 [Corymbia citriodora subsp. variegata]|nr:hypothetical protein BT93_K0700 [Corymbia citriodora subsp. variegata]
MVDNNNWRPTPPGGVGGGGGGTEAGLDGADWRSQLLPESRERIVNKMYIGCNSCYCNLDVILSQL